MKSKKRMVVLFACLTLSMGFTCNKNKLTKETQNGANTFSCLINGKLYQPCKPRGLFAGGAPLYGGYSNNFTTVKVSAICYETHPDKSLRIQLTNFSGVGEYLLSDSSNLCIYQEWYPDKVYLSSLTGKGKVTVTHEDRANLILSGRFEFTAQNTTNANDIITITSGRFDVKF